MHIDDSVSPFKSVGKLTAINKTASDYDNASLKVRRVIEKGIYHADIARYIPRTLDLVFQGIIERIKTIEIQHIKIRKHFILK